MSLLHALYRVPKRRIALRPAHPVPPRPAVVAAALPTIRQSEPLTIMFISILFDVAVAVVHEIWKRRLTGFL